MENRRKHTQMKNDSAERGKRDEQTEVRKSATGF